MYNSLFSPIRIRDVELKNRVIMPGMCTKMVREKHYVDDNLIAYHVARAEGGCALNIFECSAVCPEAHGNLYMGLYSDVHVEQLKRLTDAVHAVGGKVGVQLWHGGFAPQEFFDDTNVLESPDNLGIERIREIEKAFGHAAGLAVKAGFDVVEFHAAHSYLPHEFLSPGMNSRTDEYGGSFENRCRFCLNSIREIRANIPEGMPLFMRVDSVDELMEQNMTQDEIIRFINMAADIGVDVADLTRGNTKSFAVAYEVPSYNVPRGFNIENIAAVKRGVKIPVVGVGRINDPELANQYIEEGKADLVAVGRGQIADPKWAEKAEKGEDDRICRCIACDQGCYDAIVDAKAPHISCSRNPMVGLEYKNFARRGAPKKVLVAGGGVAGMVAARLLKQFGHEPILFEASDWLGGQFYLAGKVPKKNETAEAMAWEAEELGRLGVEIRLNTTVDSDIIEKEKPDAVIIAVGAEPIILKIPGVEDARVYSAHEILENDMTLEGDVAIIGGGSTGVETAEFLAVRGAHCTVIEMGRKAGAGLGMIRKLFMKAEFVNLKIDTVVKARCTSVGINYIGFTTEDGEKHELHCDAIVMAVGAKGRDSSGMQHKCTELGIPFYVIGDAVEARDALVATREAWSAVNSIQGNT